MRQCVIIKSITNSKLYSFEKYLKDIGRFRVLTSDEEFELVKDMKRGCSKARETLILCNLRFVVSVAKQFQNYGVSLPDLINEGNIGLMKALNNFDETKGFKFISYAVWWIRQTILCAISDYSRLVRLPHNKINSINKINSCYRKLEHRFQREPTCDEMAEELGMEPKKIERLLELVTDVLPMDVSMCDSDKKQSLEERCAMTKYLNEVHDSIFELESLRNELEGCLNLLSDKEEGVLKMYYGFYDNCPLSFEEISNKLGISMELTAKIQRKAIKKIQRLKSVNHLKSYL